MSFRSIITDIIVDLLVTKSAVVPLGDSWNGVFQATSK